MVQTIAIFVCRYVKIAAAMFNTQRSRISLTLTFALVITGFLIFLFFYIKHEFNTTRTEVTEDAMKDVVEKKELHMIIPDSRVLFVAVGEVTACIDLTKVSKADISQSKDTVEITLPQPEICYVKLDHQKSKVYDVSGVWFADKSKDMVEDVYKLAEKKMLTTATEMNLLGKARENAQLIFKPFLENVSGKKWLSVSNNTGYN
jgi:heme/copper-type cytochrome/quinol oxidase subunit 2